MVIRFASEGEPRALFFKLARNMFTWTRACSFSPSKLPRNSLGPWDARFSWSPSLTPRGSRWFRARGRLDPWVPEGLERCPPDPHKADLVFTKPAASPPRRLHKNCESGPECSGSSGPGLSALALRTSRPGTVVQSGSQGEPAVVANPAGRDGHPDRQLSELHGLPPQPGIAGVH